MRKFINWSTAIVLLGALLTVIICRRDFNDNTPDFTRTIQSHDEVHTVLVYVAHQDDEVFISSKIQEHISMGDNVYVVYTCLSDQKGLKYRNKRIIESYQALKFIGLKKENIIYLGFPDTKSHLHLKEILIRTKTVIDSLKPDLLYTSAYEGGNIDHDVANFIIGYLKGTQKPVIRVFEFPEYSPYKSIFPFRIRSFPESPPTIIRKLTKVEFKRVKAHWDFYKSQKFRFGLFLEITVGKKKAFGYEYLRPLPSHNYKLPPPAGRIAYHKYTPYDFSDFVREINKIPDTLR